MKGVPIKGAVSELVQPCLSRDVRLPETELRLQATGLRLSEYEFLSEASGFLSEATDFRWGSIDFRLPESDFRKEERKFLGQETEFRLPEGRLAREWQNGLRVADRGGFRAFGTALRRKSGRRGGAECAPMGAYRSRAGASGPSPQSVGASVRPAAPYAVFSEVFRRCKLWLRPPPSALQSRPSRFEKLFVCLKPRNPQQFARLKKSTEPMISGP